MEKIHFEILIDAPRKKVWESIVEDKPYREWTAPFMPGSYFEGKWIKGERIRFLAKNEKGEAEGMFADIAEIKLNEFISIRHLGEIKNGVELVYGEKSENWTPGYENYYLEKMGDKTNLQIDMETDEKIAAMFKDIWPQALQKLREVAER